MNADLPGNEHVGRVIEGRFRLIRRLGGTDHSSVYLTEVPGNPPQNAAIKFVPADDVPFGQWETARHLEHPHLIRFFEFGRCAIDGHEVSYAVTEFAEEVLSEIQLERVLTAAETEEMLPAVLDALDYLHTQGLVHGRLTPANILAAGERLKLSVDSVQKAGAPRHPSRLTTDYDAPEMATDKLSPAMDLWSLGVVLVKVLSRETPARKGEGDGDPVVPASVPEPFATVARECLRETPQRRCTLAQIRARLAPVPVPAAAPITATPAAPVAAPAAKAMAEPSAVLAAKPAATPKAAPGPIMPATQIPADPAKPVPALPSKPQPVGRLIFGALVLILICVVLIALHHGSHTAPPAQGYATSSASPQTQAPVAQAGPGDGSTAKGAVAQKVMPDVPEGAMRTIHGHFKVEIRVDVDSEGKVANAAIAIQGPSRYFAEYALNASREWRFRPAEQDGRAVASMWNLVFEFGRDGATVTPTETRP